MRISDWSSDVCSSDLDRLIGRESRQIGDPGAAGAEAEENQRQNAAGRRSNSPQDTAGRGPPGARPIALQLIHVLDCAQPQFLGSSHPGVLFQIALSMRSEEHTSELQSLMRISYA